MVDPAAVRTGEDLRAALRTLFANKHLSYDAVIRNTNGGVGKTTLSDIVNGKTVHPRWDTLRVVLGACGVVGAELEEWEHAYRRARLDGVGLPLDAATDPFVLEVHRPIDVDTRHDLPALPVYVRRSHDEDLDEVVRRAVDGHSAMAVLVGGSSTGKTRALWEALAPLRAAGSWRLWHPVSPSRGEALIELGRVRPRTVVWLNETQRYLIGDGGNGERTATALHAILSDSGRAPVLILGTLWPDHYRTLCQDRFAATTKLLEGTAVEVASAFTTAALRTARRAGAEDARLAMAVGHAEDNQITQYLAGGVALVARYRFACSPVAKAVIEVAMDAVRMGHRNRLPYELLQKVVPYYLAGVDRDVLNDRDWLECALDETSEPCAGIRGPVTRINPAPAIEHRGRRSRAWGGHNAAGNSDGPMVELADYLDYYGRIHRGRIIPADGFWELVADCAHPADQYLLGRSAWDRGLHRDAAQLFKDAAAQGHGWAAVELIRTLSGAAIYDESVATWVIEHIAVDHTASVGAVLAELRRAGSTQRAHELARRTTQTVDLDDPFVVVDLLKELHELGATEQLGQISTRVTDIEIPAAYGWDPVIVLGVNMLLDTLVATGAAEQADKLERRAEAVACIAEADDVMRLVRELRQTGTPLDPDEIARQFATVISLDSSRNVSWLLRRLSRLGATELARQLARWVAVSRVDDNFAGLALLMDELQRFGALKQVSELAQRHAINGDLAVAFEITKLRRALREMEPGKKLEQLFLPAEDVTFMVSWSHRKVASDYARDSGQHAATYPPLVSPEVAQLLRAQMRDGRPIEHPDERIDELPAVGLFDMFLQLTQNPDHFRFGRRPDGTAALPWCWDDLV